MNTDNELGKTALCELGPRSSADKGRRDNLIRNWLFRFSINHQAQGKDPVVTEKTAPMFVTLWSEELADIPTDALELAFQATIRTKKFFPTIADIREQIDQAEQAEFEVESEEMWNLALDYARRYYFADLGGMRGAPPLPEAVNFAVKAAGGWHRLHTCSQDELVWCRKTFLDRYKVLHKTGQAEHLLLAGDMRRIMGELKQLSQRRLAPTPVALPDSSRSEQEQNDAPKAPPKTAPKAPPQVATPKPVPYQPPGEEEIERRRQQQKQGLQDWLAAHPKRAEEKPAAVEGA